MTLPLNCSCCFLQLHYDICTASVLKVIVYIDIVFAILVWDRVGLLVVHVLQLGWFGQ